MPPGDSIEGVVEGAGPVRLATTAAERLAIARMRYEIYVVEQHDRHPEADHERRILWGPDDDAPSSLHFYIGEVEAPAGSMRWRIWPPGRIPAERRAFYSMDRLPGIDARVTCDITMFMFRPELRGTASVPALSAAAARHVVEHHGPDLAFGTCSPGHLLHYRLLGFRAFGGALVSDTFGMLIPLVCVVNDLDHLRRSGSPWYGPFRELRRAGKLPATDLVDTSALLDAVNCVVIDREEIAGELAAATGIEPACFLESLPEAARQRLAEGGFIVEVEAGTVVVRAGSSEQEMFVVLDGYFEARRAGAGLRLMSRGELFGEIAFFSSGLRTADVVAVSSGRLLILKRKFLHRLRETDPQSAIDIYIAIGRVLVARMVTG